MPSVHPLTGIELRALRRLQREQKPGRYVFMSERGAPMSAVAFRRMVTRLGPTAKMPFGIHPHMLRHSTGFKLANQGVDTRSLQHYLGHTATAGSRAGGDAGRKSKLVSCGKCGADRNNCVLSRRSWTRAKKRSFKCARSIW